MAAAAKSTASLDTYRVDTVCGEQGNTFQVVRCELVARFDLAEHAAFLVDLLTKGQPHHG
jgi:hypothetical protein